MDFLLNLIPGGSLTAIGAVIVAALVGVRRIWSGGKKAGRNEQKARESDAYEQHLREIADAARARNSVNPDGVSDDKYRRD